MSAVGELTGQFVTQKLREGGVITFPSLGVILTARVLGDTTGVVFPTRERVVRAIHDCLTVLRGMLTHVESEEERVVLSQRIQSLEADLCDPGKYLS